MNDRPLVSVVTPFLNVENFIEEAIESTFAQTYDNWELLLVDDGSSDNSTGIAMRYAKQYPEKVRYLEHEGHCNRGPSASKNLGIRKGRGIFVAFLDADDVWLSEKLQRQVAVMLQHRDVGLTFSSAFFWYKDGKKKPGFFPLPPGLNQVGEYARKRLEGIVGLNPSTALIRKDLCLRLGGFEESGGLLLYEDTTLWCKASLHSSIYYDTERMVLLRKHGVSRTARASHHETEFSRMHFYSWLFRYTSQYDKSQSSPITCTARVKWYAVLVRYLVDNMQYGAGLALVHSLEREVTCQPLDAEWQYLSAFCLHNLGDNLKEALNRYDIALKYGYDEFWVRYNRGALHQRLGNMKEAIADLEKAVALDPDHEGARQVLHMLSPEKYRGSKRRSFLGKIFI